MKQKGHASCHKLDSKDEDAEDHDEDRSRSDSERLLGRGGQVDKTDR